MRGYIAQFRRLNVHFAARTSTRIESDESGRHAVVKFPAARQPAEELRAPRRASGGGETGEKVQMMERRQFALSRRAAAMSFFSGAHWSLMSETNWTRAAINCFSRVRYKQG